MHVLGMHGKLYALYLQIIASIVSLKKQIAVWWHSECPICRTDTKTLSLWRIIMARRNVAVGFETGGRHVQEHSARPCEARVQGGNSSILADWFERGALEAGNEVTRRGGTCEHFRLHGLRVLLFARWRMRPG